MTEKIFEQPNIEQNPRPLDELAAKRAAKTAQIEADARKAEAAEKGPGFVERVMDFVEKELAEVSGRLDKLGGQKAEIVDINTGREKPKESE